MARRKRPLLDDEDSDSSAASDEGGFDVEDNDPYQRKRHRKNRGFLDDDDDDDDEFDAGPPRNRKKPDWTKAPAFVSGDKATLPKSTMSSDSDDGSAHEDDSGEDGAEEVEVGTDSSEDEMVPEPVEDKSPPPTERVVNDLQDERPRMGGIGSRPKPQDTNTTTSSTSSFAGIGMPPTSFSTSVTTDAFPSAFGAARTQRSFLRESSNSTKPNLSRAESAHFSKLQGTFGARMLAKMGWESGTGLGATRDGIVTPIDQKLRPGKIGIAFRGFKEKTEQSKAEARRRGEVPVEDNDENEDDPDFLRAKKKSERIVRSDAWKKSSKKLKTKVVSKTYEQILAEVGSAPAPPSSKVGKIIDATGAMVGPELIQVLVHR